MFLSLSGSRFSPNMTFWGLGNWIMFHGVITALTPGIFQASSVAMDVIVPAAQVD